MHWVPRWYGPGSPSVEERQELEVWVRLRFQLAASDPMLAIVGAVGRLTDAGMTTGEAIDIVLRIVREVAA